MLKPEKVTIAGINVSRLCYGTLPLSPIQGYCDTDAAVALLCRAFMLGVNFIDTAQFYQNYEILCNALDLYASHGGCREDIVIASKTYAYTAQDAERAVNEACRKMKRQRIDIFLLHEQESAHTLRGHDDALKALQNMKKSGVLRAVGLSTHHVAGAYAALDAGLDILHPLLNKKGLGIADGSKEDMECAVTACKKADMGVYLMKALGGGNLFREAESCLQYAFSQSEVVALGMRNEEELIANLNFLKTGKIPDTTTSQPRSLHIAAWCVGCGECVKHCTSDALNIQGGKAICDETRCVLCGYCGAHCKEFCIKIV